MQTVEGLDGELHRVMEEVLTGIVGDPSDLPSLGIRATTLLSCSVQIRGGWTGQVIVQASLGLATLVAIRMFGDDVRITRSATDAQDALREIANIVAGNLKPLFGEQNTLGLPEDEPGDVTYPLARQLAHAVLEHGDGRLEVRVFETM